LKGERTQFLENAVENSYMNVSGVSMFDALAAQATHMQAGNLGTRLAVTVLKSVMDSQEQQAQMLVEMIRQTTAISGSGSKVDIRA
jgi:hypothetical protein